MDGSDNLESKALCLPRPSPCIREAAKALHVETKSGHTVWRVFSETGCFNKGTHHWPPARTAAFLFKVEEFYIGVTVPPPLQDSVKLVNMTIWYRSLLNFTLIVRVSLWRNHNCHFRWSDWPYSVPTVLCTTQLRIMRPLFFYKIKLCQTAPKFARIMQTVHKYAQIMQILHKI